MSHKSRVFWPLLSLLILADCTTKELAVERLSPAYIPHHVLGSVVQFTLAYNPRTAFSIDLGPWSRPMLIVATIITLSTLAILYRRTAPTKRVMAVALALVCGGAIGNLLDRVQSTRGVVDFIDVGVGTHRFWIFNVADAGITVGAVLLAVVLSQGERRRTHHA